MNLKIDPSVLLYLFVAVSIRRNSASLLSPIPLRFILYLRTGGMEMFGLDNDTYQRDSPGVNISTGKHSLSMRLDFD